MNDLMELPSRIKHIYNSCTDNEKGYLRKILEELAETGESRTYTDIWLSDYKEIPVDIGTFLDSDQYLGRITRGGTAVYPFWRKELETVFNNGNKYSEWILTGATRIGKSSTAVKATAYMLYKLMCMKDPYKYFQLQGGSLISILFFNLTEKLAKGVAYREFNNMLAASPWFQSHGTFSDSKLNYYYIPEGGKIDISYGSDASHGLGIQLFVAFMDECNFSQAGIQDIQKAKARMKEKYDIVSTRVKGTFIQGGEVFGKVFAVSSKRSDSDFMEKYVEDQMSVGAGDHMYVSGGPQWEIFPEGKFGKETFYLAVGDRHRRGFVVPDNQCFPDALNELTEQGYTILQPPVELKTAFLSDFDVALRDQAGISIVGSMSFINQESLNRCIGVRKNPFYQDVIQIGTKDNYTIEEFFHLSALTSEVKRMAWFIHLDLSLNTDNTGISGVGITSRKDIELQDGKTISQPVFSHAFSISLKAPRGDTIPFSKITEFLCWLRKSGIHIHTISRDQFQSDYMAEILTAQGFHVTKISLDRTPEGYIATRSVLLEERIDLLDCKKLQDELIHLQRDAASGKVDHPVGGEKDEADSFAGALWSAIQANPGVPLAGKKLSGIVSGVNAQSAVRQNPVLQNMFGTQMRRP